MGAVQADISISLDGFVTRPNTDQHPGLGEGGRPLHVWVNDETGHKLLDDTFAAAGAVITVGPCSTSPVDGATMGSTRCRSSC